VNQPAALLLAALTMGFAAAGFLAPRARVGNLALAAAGATAGGLLFLKGHLGLGIAAAGVLWSLSGAAQAMARLLDEVEVKKKESPAREPWLVALLSAGILALSLALAVAAVDWRMPLAGSGSRAGSAAPWETILFSLLTLSAVASLLVLRWLPGGEEVLPPRKTDDPPA
jgi:hypothetical protein